MNKRQRIQRVKRVYHKIVALYKKPYLSLWLFSLTALSHLITITLQYISPPLGNCGSWCIIPMAGIFIDLVVISPLSLCIYMYNSITYPDIDINNVSTFSWIVSTTLIYGLVGLFVDYLVEKHQKLGLLGFIIVISILFITLFAVPALYFH